MPAPVSAITLGFFMRRASSACPMVLFDLVCAGVVQVLALDVDLRARRTARTAAGAW